MLKKVIFGTLLFFPFVSLAADVQFDITGEIKNTPCQATLVNNNESTINLGFYNTTSMSESGHSTDLVKFNITLEQCPINLDNIQFTFTGAQNHSNTDLLDINEGGASNVGIAFYEDDAKTIIPINTKSKRRSIQANAKNIMIFYASYVSTGVVTGGEANATADFSISYN